MSTENYVKATEIYGAAIKNQLQSLNKALRTPVGDIVRAVVRFFAPTAKAREGDSKRYLATAKFSVGLYGFGRYTDEPIVELTELYNIEVQDLLQERLKREPYLIMGSRQEVMDYVKGVSDKDFDTAKTMEFFRVQRIEKYVDAFVNSYANSQHVFRHWLQTQVNNGIISVIDGYVFKEPEHNPFTNSTLFKKNCEVGDFLYKYFESFRSAARLKIIDGEYYSVEMFSRQLMAKILKYEMGVLPYKNVLECFFEVNSAIRDYNTASSVFKEEFQSTGEVSNLTPVSTTISVAR